MFRQKRTIYEEETAFEQYQVVDMVYEGRPARVLFTDNHRAAQSGIATDNKPELLFDYNQRFFELATSMKPKSILVIGGGTYTLPVALAKALPDTYQDIVELDPALDTIAEKFFGLTPNPRMHIIHRDGREYLDTTTRRYDLIVIDAFIGTEIPYEFLTLDATLALRQCLIPRGLVAINSIGLYYNPGVKLQSLLASYQNVFRHTHMQQADSSLALLTSQNFIITGTNSEYARYSMRSPSLASPKVSFDNILFDNPHVLETV